MTNSMLDRILFGETALYELYLEEEIAPVFSKIIRINHEGIPLAELTDDDYEKIPVGVYLPAITVKNKNGSVRTFYPPRDVEITGE